MKKRIEQLKNQAIDLLAAKKDSEEFISSLEDEVMMILNKETLTIHEEEELKDIHYRLMKG